MVSKNIIEFKIKENGKRAVINEIVNSFLENKMIIHNNLDFQKMDELNHYEGFVPPILDFVNQDYSYLKSKGIFDDFQEKAYEYRTHMKKLLDPEDSILYSLTFLAEWIVENPQYAYVIDYIESDDGSVLDDTGNTIYRPKIPDLKNL